MPWWHVKAKTYTWDMSRHWTLAAASHGCVIQWQQSAAVTLLAVGTFEADTELSGRMQLQIQVMLSRRGDVALSYLMLMGTSQELIPEMDAAEKVTV